MIDPEELAAWLRLVETRGVSRASARALLAAFGSPQAIFAASTSARGRVVAKVAAEALATSPDGFDELLARTIDWLRVGEPADGGEPARDGGAGRDAPVRDVVVLGDPRYPPSLLQSPDPPLLLHVRGRVELLQREALAIVGSRHATPQGLDNARAFAAHLSAAGWTIVSGLALGIDAAAHLGALDGPRDASRGDLRDRPSGGSPGGANDGARDRAPAAAGGTVAVVGTGLDIAYPARHRALTDRIAAEGVVVSEFALGTPGLAEHFPIRNRIIAGLSRGTLVVEAALPSGSLVTARLASEAGREVFAIPGSIHSPQSRGCHALIKQGAKLVETAADIVEELGGAAPSVRAAVDRSPRDPLLEALGHDPIDLDTLVARTGESAGVLSARLLELELAGRVGRLPGNRFQRVARA